MHDLRARGPPDSVPVPCSGRPHLVRGSGRGQVADGDVRRSPDCGHDRTGCPYEPAGNPWGGKAATAVGPTGCRSSAAKSRPPCCPPDKPTYFSSCATAKKPGAATPGRVRTNCKQGRLPAMRTDGPGTSRKTLLHLRRFDLLRRSIADKRLCILYGVTRFFEDLG